MEQPNLPRLLYVGDVPVTSTFAGAALLYRLLQKYPPDKIKIVQSISISKSDSKNFLSEVSYTSLNIRFERIFRTRFSAIYSFYLLLTARSRFRNLLYLCDDFKPEAILTVGAGFSYLTASALAEHLSLPLHLIVHDNYLQTINLPEWAYGWASLQFANAYKKAKSRLCVSPYMAEGYKKCYGVDGDVIYPCRAKDVPYFNEPPIHNNKSLVFAYAGSINSPGYTNALVLLSSILETFECQLLIYSSLTQQTIVQIGLNKNNIIVRPMISSSELIYTLRFEADVLFLPMSFDNEDRSNMEISFPSKLTDYTAIGLPLLIYGPDYCSAVRWARENPEVAEVVDKDVREDLELSVKRLITDSQYRYNLGVKALEIGQKLLAHESVVNKFYEIISN